MSKKKDSKPRVDSSKWVWISLEEDQVVNGSHLRRPTVVIITVACAITKYPDATASACLLHVSNV